MRIAILCTAAVLAWQAAVIQTLWNGNLTGLFCAGSRTPVPAELAEGLARVPDSNGYDGAYYRTIAHDPFFRRGFASTIDDAQLRYRRILLPAAAWALGLGQDRYIDAAYAALIAASVFFGVRWTAAWFRLRGFSEAWGAIFLLAPATLTSVDRMLLDGPLCTFLAGIALSLARGGDPRVLLGCATLCKETGVLIGAGVAAVQLRRREWRALAGTAATQAPALAWFAFVATQTQPSKAISIAARPLWGQFERLLTARDYPTLTAANEAIVQAADAISIVSLLVSIALAIWMFRRLDDAIGVTAILFALLGAALGSPDHLAEAYGFARPVSPMLWALMVYGVAERRWAALLAPLGLTAYIGLFLGSEFVRMVR
ncbi:MAG: hypothetical protein R2729_13325 [Bryobacteraceae bacterium]